MGAVITLIGLLKIKISEPPKKKDDNHSAERLIIPNISSRGNNIVTARILKKSCTTEAENALLNSSTLTI